MAKPKRAEASYKVLVLGDSDVGKTCLINRFCDGNFSENYINTIGIDFKEKFLNIEGEKVNITIWDTAGQERFRTLTTGYYRGAHGIILVYDITSDDTFSSLAYWLKNIDNMAPGGISKVLVGNKSDLTAKRQVSESRGRQLAVDFKVDFFETSCKNNVKVDETFECLVKGILKSQVQKAYERVQLNHATSLQPPSPPSSPKKKPKCAC